MAADRGAFICQSQSLNLFVDNPTTSKLTSMHFYAWKKGLKTGMYYLRTKAAAQAIQFTLEKQNKSLEPTTADKENDIINQQIQPTNDYETSPVQHVRCRMDV